MSKKKRKTRAEKAVPKKHDFDIPVYKLSEPTPEESVDKKIAPKKEDIDHRVLVDLKKVGLVIVIMVLLLILVSVLAYKTDLINPFLERFGISY